MTREIAEILQLNPQSIIVLGEQRKAILVHNEEAVELRKRGAEVISFGLSAGSYNFILMEFRRKNFFWLPLDGETLNTTELPY